MTNKEYYNNWVVKMINEEDGWTCASYHHIDDDGCCETPEECLTLYIENTNEMIAELLEQIEQLKKKLGD